MLEVNIEKIVPVTEARDMFNKIVDDVEGTDELYVLTKNGKPAAVVVGVNHLEKLTGQSHSDASSKIEEASGAAIASIAADPVAEESETVFASADDAQLPAAAEMSAPVAANDPFAMAANELATQQAGAVASPMSSLAESSLTPTAASTDLAGGVSNITPIPEGFNNGMPTAEEVANPYTSPAEESTEEPAMLDETASADASATTFATGPMVTPDTDTASVDSMDDSAGPILPPRQGM